MTVNRIVQYLPRNLDEPCDCPRCRPVPPCDCEERVAFARRLQFAAVVVFVAGFWLFAAAYSAAQVALRMDALRQPRVPIDEPPGDDLTGCFE